MPVYLIRSGTDGLVKIGVSRNLPGRILKMRTDSPYELTILRVIEGDRKVEAALHERFSALRVRGEWFTYSDEMLGDLGPVHVPAAAKGKGWTPERRAKMAETQRAIHADPVKGAIRQSKLAMTAAAKYRFSSVQEAARRSGGWQAFATALNTPVLEVVAWKTIPLRHLEAAAAAAKVPVIKLSDIAERR